MIVCKQCGNEAPRTGPRQFFCKTCSAVRDVARKVAHSNKRGKQYGKEAHSRIAERGRQISAMAGPFSADDAVDLIWTRTAIIPFSWAGSKNHTFTSRFDGHTELRSEARRYKIELIEAMREALASQLIVTNKLWVDVLVEKPSHRGDAANLLDMICDAVKEAAGLDDRWFSIHRVDWRIVKQNPRLIVRVGQQSNENVQACSSCGRLLTLMHFHANKGTKNGVGRNCRDCSTARVPGRQMVEPVP